MRLALKQAVTGIVMDDILKLPAEYLQADSYACTILKGQGIGQVLRKGMTAAEKEETLQTLSSLNMRGFMGAVMYVLQTVFALEERYLLCPPDEKKGKILLEEILEGGNFGHYNTRANRRNLLNKVKRRMNRLFRIYSLAPSEAVWSFLFFTWSFFKRRIHPLRRKQTD